MYLVRARLDFDVNLHMETVELEVLDGGGLHSSAKDLAFWLDINSCTAHFELKCVFSTTLEPEHRRFVLD